MNNNPAVVPNSTKKNPPPTPDQEAAKAPDDQPQTAAAAPQSEEAGATNDKAPPKDEKNTLDDFSEQDKQNAEQSARFDERVHNHFHTTYVRYGGTDYYGETEIKGDAINGDAIKRAAAAADDFNGDVSGQIPSRKVKERVGTYVKPAAYQRASKILSEKHVLIIFGDADMGKESAAIYLLESFRQEMLFQLAPTLPDLTTFKSLSRRGYLWDTPPGEKIPNRLSVFDQLSQNYQQQESYLVITLAKGTRISAEIKREYVVEWGDCPDNLEVFERHLAWHLKNESEEVHLKVDDLRRQQSVHTLIEDRTQRPARIAQLAALLIWAARDEHSLEEVLAEFDDRKREDAQGWFERESELNRQLQMIALAVLSGSSFQEIIEGSKRLGDFIGKSENLDLSKTTAAVEKELSTNVNQWLIEFKAKIVVQEIRTEFGLDKAEAIVFERPKFQTDLLAYIWQELPFWRPPLFSWLLAMGNHGNLADKIVAAATIGELSQYNAFEYTLRNAVGLWAKADDPDQRRLAAFTLQFQALEKKLSASVLGLLHHWANADNNWRLQWTAATAYGAELGVDHPELAMRDLRKVLLSHNLVLHVTVLHSLRSLFEFGRQHPLMFTLVLRTLDNWSRDEELRQSRQSVLFIFHALLKSNIQVEGRKWPTILRLAYLDQTCERQFRSLLGLSLMNNEIRSSLLEDLRDWVVEAERNQEMYKLLGRALLSLFKTPTPAMNIVRRIVLDRLRRWRDEEQSQSAGKLLTIITPPSSQ